MNSKNIIETVTLKENIKLSGYQGEYVFEKIKSNECFYEQELLDKWILPNKDKYKVIYDIGANIGNHTTYFALKTTEAHIFSFEPVSENYKMLEENINNNNLSNVKAFNYALGASNMEAYMNFEIENNNGTATIEEDATSGLKVDVKVIDELNLPAPDFVKIDVEGFEFEVLKGMKKTLEKSNADLWIEVGEKNAINVTEFLSDLGYGVEDCLLQASNNIIFKKNISHKKSDVKVFSMLLQEAEKKRENWILLGKKVSQFTYEQNKANNLKKDLSSSMWKEKKLQEELDKNKKKFEDLTSKLNYQEKIAADNLDKLKIMTSNYTDEQKKSNELQKKSNELQKKSDKLQQTLDMYNKSKLFKLVRLKWKMSSNIKFYGKKRVYSMGNYIYIKLLPHPKLRNICARINNKLHIFNNTERVKNYSNDKLLLQKKHNTVDSNRTPKQINVAMIVDEFSYNSFKFECNALPIEPSNWQKVFAENDIDLFFCESAWSGVDSVRRPWKGQIYCSTNFKNENRGTLLSILDYCKKNNIPTVFWNKEDPTHYSDKIHNFVDTAIKFDYLFTTDSGCIEKYKNEYGHKNVDLLMFATQPKLFNPIEKYDRSDEIIFAGSWYKQHPVRCEEMGGILDNIIKSKYDLKIYNRYSESDDPNHIFPERFQKYLHKCLHHDQIDVAYKSSKYALNINTVTGSDTMFARRVFELMSSNTLVLSNYSKGMEELFGEDVVFIDGEKKLDIENVDEKRIDALYNVLKYHTYKKRFCQILDKVKIKYKNEDDSVAMIYRITDMNEADLAYDNYISSNCQNKKAYFFLKKGCTPENLRNILTKYQSENIIVYSQDYDLKYSNNLNINSAYFIFCNCSLKSDFINRAINHFCYIDESIGIGDNGKFKINRTKDLENVVFKISCFDKIKDIMFNGEEQAIDVYGID